MSWKGPVKSVFVDLPEDLHQTVKATAMMRNLTTREAYIDALDRWLAEDSRSVQVSPAYATAVRNFVQFLESSGRDADLVAEFMLMLATPGRNDHYMREHIIKHLEDEERRLERRKRGKR